MRIIELRAWRHTQQQQQQLQLQQQHQHQQQQQQLQQAVATWHVSII